MKNKFFYFKDEIIAKYLAEQCEAELVDKDKFNKNPYYYANSYFLVRGITNFKYLKKIKELNSHYFYIDTGYFGNLNSYYTDKISGKSFHRVVYDGMQTWNFNLKKTGRYKKVFKMISKEYGLGPDDIIKPWKKKGDKILICPPSKKSAHILVINEEEWINYVIGMVKKQTDAEIIIRHKPASRSERMGDNTLQKELDNGVSLLITANSIAATEAIIHGVSALTLYPNAADPVSIKSIENIHERKFVDRIDWLSTLSEEQYHVDEFEDGTVAKNILSLNLDKNEAIQNALFKKRKDKIYINPIIDKDRKISKIISDNVLKSYKYSNTFSYNEEIKLDNSIYVINGPKSVEKYLNKIINKHKNYFYIDNSYIYSNHYRIIFNHIHPQKNDYIDFTQTIGMRKWTICNNNPILICPPSGKILENFGNFENWLFKTLEILLTKTNKKIKIRFKKLKVIPEENIEKIKNIYKNVDIYDAILRPDLEKDLLTSYAVIAPASGVGVKAGILGIPVFSENFGPAADIACHDYSLINEPIIPDRKEWIKKILVHDFSDIEFSNGTWLTRLKKVYSEELKDINYEDINLL